MRYLLDTDRIIDHLRKKNRLPPDIIEKGAAISIISYGELLYGAEKSANNNRALTTVETFLNDLVITTLPLNESVMKRYAELKARLEQKGQKLDDFDLLIAATALEHNLILVTDNRRHFSRIPTLQLFP